MKRERCNFGRAETRDDDARSKLAAAAAAAVSVSSIFWLHFSLFRSFVRSTFLFSVLLLFVELMMPEVNPQRQTDRQTDSRTGKKTDSGSEQFPSACGFAAKRKLQPRQVYEGEKCAYERVTS